MQFTLEKGESIVEASFKETPLRKLSNILSVFSFALALVVIIKYVKAVI